MSELLFLSLKHKIHIFSSPCNILYILQRFIQVARGSYVYFVEYIWKNNPREETTSKARNGDVTSEEILLIDEDEEQG